MTQLLTQQLFSRTQEDVNNLELRSMVITEKSRNTTDISVFVEVTNITPFVNHTRTRTNKVISSETTDFD